MSGKKAAGRPASYDHTHVRAALEMWCGQFGRVPTHLHGVAAAEILPILSVRFGVRETIRQDSLQKVVDDLFGEFVARQRADDRAALPAGQLERITMLTTALGDALVDAFTAENGSLARAQFDTIRKADVEKDALKQRLNEAGREIEELSDLLVDLRAEIEVFRSAMSAQTGEIDALRLENSRLHGYVEMLEKYPVNRDR